MTENGDQNHRGTPADAADREGATSRDKGPLDLSDHGSSSPRGPLSFLADVVAGINVGVHVKLLAGFLGSPQQRRGVGSAEVEVVLTQISFLYCGRGRGKEIEFPATSKLSCTHSPNWSGDQALWANMRIQRLGKTSKEDIPNSSVYSFAQTSLGSRKKVR